MAEVTIIGIDLAKRAFQLHGASTSGSVCFRRNCCARPIKAACSQFNRKALHFPLASPKANVRKIVYVIVRLDITRGRKELV